MTRKDVLKKQLIAAGMVLILAVVAISISCYMRTFDQETQLRRTIVYAAYRSQGPPMIEWTDPEVLARIRNAVPKYRPGAGYAPHVHSHESLNLLLKDDKGKQVILLLPTDQSSMVVVHTHLPDYSKGDSWHMPELLGVLGELGVDYLKDHSIESMLGASQLAHWKEHFAKRE